MKISTLTSKKLPCIMVALSLIVSPASAIAEESESTTSSEAPEVASETVDETSIETAVVAANEVDSEIEVNDNGYQDNIIVSSSLLSTMSDSSALTLQSDEDIASGEYYGLTWKITSDGVLVLGDGTEQTYGAIPVTTSTPQPWSSYVTSITSAEVDGIVHATSNSLTGFLSGATNLLSIDLDGLDTSEATTMSGMFRGCSKLTSVPLSNFDTSNVASMDSMFNGCSSLSQLDVLSFNTSNVANMNDMFYNCSKLATLDVSNFDTSNVINASQMFRGCKKLSTIDVTSWNTAKIKNAAYLFHSCAALSNINLTNWDTSSMTSLGSMFYGCSSLKTLDLSNFNTSNVTSMSFMFYNCLNLEEIVGIDSFDTSKVTGLNYAFYNCQKLASLDVSRFNTSSVTNMSYAFNNCRALKSLDVSSFNTSKVTSMNNMFSNCYNLEALDVSKFDTSRVTDMGSMFGSCQKLTSIDVSEFDTAKVKNMSSMFNNCLALTSIDLSNFDMSLSSSTYNTSTKAFGIKSMFANCTALSSIKLGENNVLYASGDVNGKEVTCSVDLPNAPTNDDYQGKWWIGGGTGYTAADLMSSYDGSTMSGTYEWMPVTYAITYVAPDGLPFENGEQVVTENVMKNDSFEVETGNELLEDDAYYVTSWNTQADGSGVTYENGVTYIPTSDVTLYAVTEMGGVATGKTDTHNLDSDGDGYGDNISFSVPTSIYGYVNADGTIFVSDSDFYIENCSSEDISIAYITSDGWDSRVNVVDNASSSTAENALSITMEPVASEGSSPTPVKNGSMTYLYNDFYNPNWKVGSGSFVSPTKLYIDVEMNMANVSDELFSYEPMKIGSMHWYCQLAKYADKK